MEKSGFFDAVYDESTSSYDLEYFADEFAKYFSMFVGSGVFGTPTNQLRVLAQSGMNVVVRPGAAFIRGYWYTSDEDIVIPWSEIEVIGQETVLVTTDSIPFDTRTKKGFFSN